MVNKGNLDIDARGLIFEAYRIEGITLPECRTIFLDWALGAPAGDMNAYLHTLLDAYAPQNPDHPMTQTLREGLDTSPHRGRRGGRAGRRT